MLRLIDFEGIWRIHRVIEGRPMAGHMIGSAEFWRDGAELIYRESGTLTLTGGQEFQSTREYRWAQDGDRIVVRFADGRPFHDFLPGTEAEGRHWCAPDAYEVAYGFADWPVWTSRWQVRGPQKDYRMLTRHARPT